MELPITERELETIILLLKAPQPALYAKLWSYKMNNLIKRKKDGLS
jgi:hypothetical protein